MEKKDKESLVYSNSSLSLGSTIISGLHLGPALEDKAEFDEAIFGKAILNKTKIKPKLGRGTEKKSKLAVMAESIVIVDCS